MKNLMCLGVMVLFMVASCNNTSKNSNDIVVEDKKAKTDLNDNTDPCDKCIASDQIYPVTAMIWAQSWVTAFNWVNKPQPEAHASPEFFFSKEILNELKSKNSDPDNGGVLLYYILKDSMSLHQANKYKTIPSLAMLNTVCCKKDSNCSHSVNDADKVKEKCVVVSWYTKGKTSDSTGFIPYDKFSEYQMNWERYDSTLATSGIAMEGYQPIKGYNYSWPILSDLYIHENNPSQSKIGIRVKYGVRTLAPGESDSLGYENYMTGSPVLCNVLIGSELETTFKKIMNENPPTELDFAKPCPTYCD